jgi:hypothetical protein
MAPTNDFRGAALIARLRAAAIHFALSLTAVGVLVWLMLQFWYPQPYFRADGGWRVLRIIVLVDVVLGPLLTFVVFNRAKRELVRDLAVIAVIQVVAFGYGAVTMYQYRPVFLAAVEQTLYTVNWPELERVTQDLATVRSLAAGQTTPVMADIKLPASTAERERMWFTAAQQGILPPHQAARYAAMTPERMTTLLDPGVDIDSMAKGDADIAAELARVMKSHPNIPRAQMAFVPLNGRFELIMLVFDRETRRVIDWMI